MAVTHKAARKRKKTGGRRRPLRRKRKYELGSAPTHTTIGEKDVRKASGRKLRIRGAQYANVYNPTTKKHQKVKLLSAKANPANRNYPRMNVITKGAIVDTEIGTIKITSRPGQHGVVNATLLPKEEKEKK